MNAGDEEWRRLARQWEASGDPHVESAYLAAWERAGSPGRDPRHDPVPGDVVEAPVRTGWRGSSGYEIRYEIRRYLVLPPSGSSLHPLSHEPMPGAWKYVDRRCLGWVSVRTGALAAIETGREVDQVLLQTWKAWARGGRVARRMPTEEAPSIRPKMKGGRKKKNPRVPGSAPLEDFDAGEQRRGRELGRAEALDMVRDRGCVTAEARLQRFEHDAPSSVFDVGTLQGWRGVVRNPPRGDEHRRDLERRAAHDPEAAAALARLQQRTDLPPWSAHPWARLLMDALSNVDSDEVDSAASSAANVHYLISPAHEDANLYLNFLTYVEAHFGSIVDALDDTSTLPAEDPVGLIYLRRKHWTVMYDPREYPDLRVAHASGRYEEDGYLFVLFRHEKRSLAKLPAVLYGTTAWGDRYLKSGTWKPQSGRPARLLRGVPYWVVESELVPSPWFVTTPGMWEIVQSGVIW